MRILTGSVTSPIRQCVRVLRNIKLLVLIVYINHTHPIRVHPDPSELSLIKVNISRARFSAQVRSDG